MIEKIQSSGFSGSMIAAASGAGVLLLRLAIWLIKRASSGSGPFRSATIEFADIKVRIARKSGSRKRAPRSPTRAPEETLAISSTPSLGSVSNGYPSSTVSPMTPNVFPDRYTLELPDRQGS